ncbi:hypothetical protein K469DRAFT_729757 [Zopfia rhizophila CBS 207.26]|uniref:Uridine/cytidine kinase n=1 Tax=Zopfia rhizophila CBS 207.26 TaxID=1314779 RepID=A0A6A6DS55_9PEZI|nr:hypothetical protein K469DRAFT_729757 [Zopfia rhizophila CBS 207.26]
MTSKIIDDKSVHCIPFISEHLSKQRRKCLDKGEQPLPCFLELNGVQGAGKTTLTSRSPPRSLPTTILSIDDLYPTHTAQVALAQSRPDNPLIQHRGEPSTHGLGLGASVFAALKARQPGDRAHESEEVNKPGEPTIDVVVFEGWCVGFRPLSDAEVEKKWTEAREEKLWETQLAKHRLRDLLFVNDALEGYSSLHAFINIDAEDTKDVYEWRLEQEAALRASKGTGMTDEQVINFVNGYYPAYELYTATLRQGIFDSGGLGRQLRLIVDRGRRVKSVERA